MIDSKTIKKIQHVIMKKEIFKPIKPEKIVVSVRMDLTLLQELNRLSGRMNISRNGFIVQCIEYAIKNVQN